MASIIFLGKNLALLISHSLVFTFFNQHQRKILDALTTKRIREKEYEQLAIWFGDADMGSDLVSGDSEAIDFKSSQVHESADSQWELL